MDNIENKNNKCTLLQLLKDFEVEIPRIQRDYAQGRNDNITTIIRNNFLDDIKSLLDNKDKTLNLFYIYGKIENKKFYPLDGQQRLTTLFLLHIYAYSQCKEKTDSPCNEKPDILKKFSYVARTTTKDFFSKLVEPRKDIITDYICDYKKQEDKSKSSLKDIITDYSWFIYSWIYDPSVIGAITTLEAICKKFDGKEEKLRELLESDRLFFYFTGIEDLGKEDDLYIKLNARGRQLTDFENFKSKFVDIINSYSKDEKGKKYFTEIESEENKIDIEDFYNKLDAKWSDAIWNISEKNIINYNKYFLNFFDIVLTNFKIKEHKENENDVSWIYNIAYDKDKAIIVKDDKEKDSQYITDTTAKSDEANVLYNILRLIRNTFNYIISENKEENVYNYLKEAIKKPTNTNKNKIWFHVISKYLLDEDNVENINQECFQEWIRIFKNLINNTEINNQNYNNILNFIDDFATNKYREKSFNLLEYFANENNREKIKNLKGFFAYQIKEECIKAHLMINKGYKKEIEEAERNLEYFSGQIGSALLYSYAKYKEENKKIEDLYCENNLEEYMTIFEKYVDILSSIFNKKEDIQPRERDILIRRLLLCFGDYSKETGKNNYSLYKSDKGSPYSFKKLLLESMGDERYDIINNLLDEVSNNQSNDIYKIIEDKLNSIEQKDWRYCFIKYPDIFYRFRFNPETDYRIQKKYKDNNIYDIYITNNKINRGWKYSVYLGVIYLLYIRDKKITNPDYYPWYTKYDDHEHEYSKDGKKIKLTKTSQGYEVEFYTIEEGEEKIEKDKIIINSKTMIDNTFTIIKDILKI